MLTRLAPTPSGYMHTGNICNFLLNWLWAKSNNGKILLRIDDADTERKRQEYVEDIFRVLNWLGLQWDIGPTGPDDFEKNWSQQKRKDLYENVLKELAAKNLLFACNCSRKEICICSEKNLPLDTQASAWKIKTDVDSTVQIKYRLYHTVSMSVETNFVVKKKDGFAAYQICSLADDINFGSTHIARGEDLLASTAMQLYIDKQLQHQYLHNCIFWHHPLITNNDGNKLSKSAGAMSSTMVGTIQKEKVFAGFAQWLGICKEEAITLEETAAAFKTAFQRQ